jgi:N-acetylmuramoyl-L-alanine amidase
MDNGWLHLATKRPSPNFTPGRSGHAIATGVVHYSGGTSARSTLRWLRDKDSKVSTHFLIGRSGVIYQLVSIFDSAWHAGLSRWWYQGEITQDVNKFSIGIELANVGHMPKRAKKKNDSVKRFLRRKKIEPMFEFLKYDTGETVGGNWEPYDSRQIQSLKELITYLYDLGFPLSLVGHEEIAMPPGRKKDPGPLFPWDKFFRDTDRKTFRA